MENLAFMNLGAPEIILLLMVGGIPFLLTIYCLFDITRSTFKDPTNKIIWVIITVFVPIFGPILYIAFGRNQKTVERT
jgi:hypothetical protein